MQRETAKTIVFVTHDIDEALLLGSRIIVFSDRPGRIVHEETRASSRLLSRAYFFTDSFASEKRKYTRLLDSRKLRVGLSDWEGHAPTIHARQSGFIPDQLDIQFGRSGSTRKDDLLQGRADCLGITLNSVLDILPHGKGQIVLSTIGSKGHGTDVLVAKKDRVSSVEDLNVGRLIFASGSLEHVTFALILDSTGRDPAELRRRDPNTGPVLRGSYLDALRSDGADAAVLCEPYISDLLSSPDGDRFHIIDTSIDQKLLHQVCFARKETLSQKRDLLLNYLRFVLQSNAFLLEDEAEVLAGLHRDLRRDGGRSSFVRSTADDYFLFDNVVYYDLEDNIRLFLDPEPDGGISGLLRQLWAIAWKAGAVAEEPNETVIQTSVDECLVRTLAEEHGFVG